MEKLSLPWQHSFRGWCYFEGDSKTLMKMMEYRNKLMGKFKCYLSVAVVSVHLNKVLDKGANLKQHYQ